MEIKELAKQITETIEENERMIKAIEELARLWVRWNIKYMTADDLVIKLGNIFPKEINARWQMYITGKARKGKDPLEALFI